MRSINEAWARSGSRVTAFAASAAVAGRGSAPFAEFVADDVARPAAFSRHRRSGARPFDALLPASVEASANPYPVGWIAYLVGAGISDPASGSPCLGRPGGRAEEGHSDGRDSPDAGHSSPKAGLARDWRQVNRGLRPLGRPQPRVH